MIKKSQDLKTAASLCLFSAFSSFFSPPSAMECHGVTRRRVLAAWHLEIHRNDRNRDPDTKGWIFTSIKTSKSSL